jgi:hypothetical protein
VTGYQEIKKFIIPFLNNFITHDDVDVIKTLNNFFSDEIIGILAT